jgi:hypothetical protein
MVNLACLMHNKTMTLVININYIAIDIFGFRC